MSDDVRSVMVIGLGRFGSSAAAELVRLGYEVIGVDENPERVSAVQDDLAATFESSCATPRSLEQMGAQHVDAAVVAIGDDIEASVLVTLNLVEIGVPRIWAKAVNVAHQTILERVGAHQVVLPEVEMGRSIAHRISDRVHDYFEIEPEGDGPGFVLLETEAPPSLAGKTLAAADIRRFHEVTIVSVKQPGRSWELPRAESKIYPGAIVLVAGEPAKVEQFADST